MTATAHAVIGTVIAAKIGNPFIAFPIAVFSHLAADAFPHWDSGTNEPKKGRKRVQFEAYFDVIFGFILSYVLIALLFPQTNLIYAFFMIIAAQGFDWATAPAYFFKWNFPPFSWAYKVQLLFDNKLDKPWGVINQISVLSVLVYLAKMY